MAQPRRPCGARALLGAHALRDDEPPLRARLAGDDRGCSRTTNSPTCARSSSTTSRASSRRTASSTAASRSSTAASRSAPTNALLGDPRGQARAASEASERLTAATAARDGALSSRGVARRRVRGVRISSFGARPAVVQDWEQSPPALCPARGIAADPSGDTPGGIARQHEHLRPEATRIDRCDGEHRPGRRGRGFSRRSKERASTPHQSSSKRARDAKMPLITVKIGPVQKGAPAMATPVGGAILQYIHLNKNCIGWIATTIAVPRCRWGSKTSPPSRR